MAAAEAPGFDAFFRTEYPNLFRTLYLVCGSVEETEDIVQEAFFKLWRRWDLIDDIADPRAYLYGIAFNVRRTWRRHASRALSALLPIRSSEEPFSLFDEHDVLMKELHRLSRQQRTAIVLTELLDLSSEEAATLMGIRPSTVRVHTTRARESLQRALREGNDD